MATLSARTLTSLGWGGILARQRDDVVAAAGRGTVRVHGGLEPTTRLDQRAEHHREVTPAHLGLGRLRVLRQPRPGLVVVPVGEQPREAVIELLFRRARPALGAAHELVRHAAAGHERGAPPERRRRARDVPAPREALAQIGGEAHRHRHRRDPLRPVEVTHEGHDRSVVERVVHVVGERARQARRAAALDHRGRQLEVAGKIVGDAVDQLRRLLRGEHALVAWRAVDDGGKRRDQVAGVDDDDVGRERGHVPPLRHHPVAHRLEVRMRELARERGVVGAVAGRVDGEIDAGEPHSYPPSHFTARLAPRCRSPRTAMWYHGDGVDLDVHALARGRPPNDFTARLAPRRRSPRTAMWYHGDGVDLDVHALARGRPPNDFTARLAPRRRSPRTATVVRAGCTPLKYSRNTVLKMSKSFMSRRKTPTFTTLASEVPAASSTLVTLSRVTRVCSARSSETTCLVTRSSGPCPDTKTKSPHFTPCAIGDSVPSENPVFGAAFVKTTSGFTRILP